MLLMRFGKGVVFKDEQSRKQNPTRCDGCDRSNRDPAQRALRDGEFAVEKRWKKVTHQFEARSMGFVEPLLQAPSHRSTASRMRAAIVPESSTCVSCANTLSSE